MSDAELHRRASAMFLRLRTLPETERRAIIDRDLADDAPLRAEVLALLEHDLPDELMADNGEHACEAMQSAPTFDGGASVLELPAWFGQLPERIGPYRVLGRLGHGGSGHVFLGEQDQPIRRKVAIKVVPQAAVNPELAARFDVERRALECTEHPNIARVLDAGHTAEGLPYLVMDYVAGEVLTDYCRRHGLSLVERIELVLEIADALQHAHQRGVVHRDIKPANVLVVEVDGRPTPRVLDFGIAKPVSSALKAESPVTAGLPIGTPSYMAPEQTGTHPVDIRADVYALGAVLYELVAGRPPLELSGDSLTMLRRIREEVPPPASRARRGESSRESARAGFVHDLDCILARALEKSPDRRYATMSAFADDLRRLLRLEPIEARRPTWRYRAARFAQRNRALVASAAAIVLFASLGIVGLTVGLVQAHQHRLEAIRQGEAQREINRFLTDDLLGSAMPDELGSEVSARDLLDRASARIDHRFDGRPRIAAILHETVAAAYAELGLYDEGEKHIERALWLWRDTVGSNAPETVRAEIGVGSLLVRRQQNDEAEAALTAAIDRARVILGPEDPKLYTALNDLGVVYITVGRADEAVAVLREALMGRTRLLGPLHRDVLISTGNLAYAYDESGDTERALRMMKECLRIAEALPETPQMTLLTLHNNLGATYLDLQDHDAAAPYLSRAVELAEQVLGNAHPSTLTIRGNLAGLQAKIGDPESAAATYLDIANKRAEAFGPDAADTLTARYGYCNALRLMRRFEEAGEAFEQLHRDITRALGPEHWLAAQTEASLARCLLDSGRTDEALPLARNAEAALARVFGMDHHRTRSATEIITEIERSRSD